MRRNRRRFVLTAATLGAATVATSVASGANSTWTGASGVDVSWSTAGNWAGSSVPGTNAPSGNTAYNDVATFNIGLVGGTIGGSTNSVLVDSGRIIGGITFDTAAVGAYQIGSNGGNSLILQNVGSGPGSHYIQMTSTVATSEVIAAPLVFRAPSSTNGIFAFSNNAASASNTLSLTGTLTSSATRAAVIDLEGSNTGVNIISGVMSFTGTTVVGPPQLIKRGTGTWVISGANTFSGTAVTNTDPNQGIQVLDGVLSLQNNNALGTNVNANTIQVNIGNKSTTYSYGTASNTFTSVTGGTLELANNITLDNGLSLNLFNGGTIRSNGSETTNARINVQTTSALAASLTTVGASDVFTVGNGANDFTGGASDSVVHIAGPGTVFLSQASNYIGTMSVDAGTLRLGSSTAIGAANTAGVAFGSGSTGKLQLFGNSTTVATLNSNATVGTPIIENGAAGTATLTISATSGTSSFGGVMQDGTAGTFSLIKDGASTLRLSGASTYSGGTTLANGNLVVANTTGSATGVGLLSINAGTLSGAGTVGAVTLSGGTIAPGATGVTLGVGALNYTSGTFGFTLGSGNAASKISAVSAAFGGVVPTFSYAATGLTNGEVFTVLSTTSGITGFTAPANQSIGRITLTPSLSGNNVILTATGSAANLVWAGTNAGTPADLTTWDIQTNKNWLNGSAADYYYEADKVTFNDANNNKYAVTLNSTVNPGSVTVNASGNYSITTTASGSIAGAASLTKSGSGNLTIGTTNSYTGGTNISGGTLTTSVVGALPAGSAVTVQAGTLDLAGNSQTLSTLSDGGVATGTVTSSTGTPTLTLTNTTGTFSGAVNGTVGLLITGSGALSLSNSNSYSGGTTLTAGTLTGTATRSFGTGSVTVAPAGTTVAGSTTLNSTGSIGPAASVTVNSNGAAIGTLNFNDPSPAVGSLAGTGNIVLNNSTGTTLTTNTTTTTTFSGVLSQGAAAGGLTVTGSGNLVLSGANTFNGSTSVIGSSTLTVNNTLALQNSTLNVTGAGASIGFSTLTAATLGGLTGSQGIALTNANSAAVALTIGNNGAAGTYSAALSGVGSLVKVGAGVETLSGASTYAGATSVNGGTLSVTGSLGTSTAAVSVPNGANVLTIAGGTVNAASVAAGGAGATVSVSGGGTLTVAGTLQVNYATSEQSTAGLIALTNGTVTANAVYIGRAGQTINPPTAPAVISSTPTNDDFYVNGGSLAVAGTLNLGTNGGTNSNAIFHQDAGTVTVGGTTTIAANSSRISIVDVNGGTFTSTDTGPGIQLGGGTNLSSGAELLVRGTGVVTTNTITFGSSTSIQNAGSSTVELIGGTLYLGSGGFVVANTGVTNAINLGVSLAAVTTVPTIAATGDWTSPIGMTLTNNTTGGTPVFHTADASNVPHKITVNGALSGTGGLTLTGGGTLTLSAVNSYTGATTVNSGTLALTTAASNNIATSAKVIVNGTGKLDATGVGGFAIASGQVLGGAGGTVVGTTTVGTGSTITGGSGVTATDAVGVLHTGAQVWTGGTFTVKLDGTQSTVTPGVGSDELVLSGLTASNSSGTVLTISPVFVTNGTGSAGGYVAGTQYSYVIANDKAGSFTSASVFDGLTLGTNVAVSSPYTLTSQADTTSGGVDLVLSFDGAVASAPEPTSLLLAGIAAAPLTLGRRRRRSA